MNHGGTRVAVGAWHLWVKQLDTGPLTPLTFEGVANLRATWSPDSRSLTFPSTRAGNSTAEGNHDLWTKRADGSGVAELVLDREEYSVIEALYSPDRRWLIFREGTFGVGFSDIYAKRGDSVAVPLVATEFMEYSPALSPCMSKNP